MTIVAGAILLAAAVLPYDFGVQTETLYLDGMRGYAEAGRWRVHRNEFDRGWFRSSAHSDIEAGDMRIKATHVIDHGPLPLSRLGSAPWSWRLRQAVIRTEALFESSLGGQALPLAATTSVAIDGNAIAKADIAAGSHGLSPGGRLSWEPVAGELHLQPATTAFHGSAQVPGLIVRSQGVVVTAEDCGIRFTQHLDNSGLPLGLTHSECGTVSVAAEGQPAVFAEAVALTSRGDEQSAGLRYELGLAFERLAMDRESHGPGTWSLVVDSLDAASVSRLRAADAAAEIQLSDLLGAVARHNAQLESTLALSGSEGKVDARLIMRLDESADPGNPFTIVTALDAAADIRAPAAVVRRWLAMAMGRQTKARASRPGASSLTPQRRQAMVASQVDQRIRQWQSDRYLVEDQDHYRLSATYRKGVLLVNGNITDWMSAFR